MNICAECPTPATCAIAGCSLAAIREVEAVPSGPQERSRPSASSEAPEPSPDPDASPAEAPEPSPPDPASEVAPTATRTMHPPPDDAAEVRDTRRLSPAERERDELRGRAEAYFRKRFPEALEVKARFYSNPPDIYVEVRHPEQGGTDVFIYTPEET